MEVLKALYLHVSFSLINHPRRLVILQYKKCKSNICKIFNSVSNANVYVVKLHTCMRYKWCKSDWFFLKLLYKWKWTLIYINGKIKTVNSCKLISYEACEIFMNCNIINKNQHNSLKQALQLHVYIYYSKFQKPSHLYTRKVIRILV